MSHKQKENNPEIYKYLAIPLVFLAALRIIERPEILFGEVNITDVVLLLAPIALYTYYRKKKISPKS